MAGLTLAFALGGVCRAEETGKFYGGVGAARSPIDNGVTELQLLGGLQINPTLSVEAGTGRLIAPRGSASQFLDNARNYRISTRLQGPEYRHLTPFITGGLAQTRAHTMGGTSCRSTGLTYGAGVKATVLKRVDMRLEWQQLNTTGPANVRPGLISFSVGLRF